MFKFFTHQEKVVLFFVTVNAESLFSWTLRWKKYTPLASHNFPPYSRENSLKTMHNFSLLFIQNDLVMIVIRI